MNAHEREQKRTNELQLRNRRLCLRLRLLADLVHMKLRREGKL